MNYTELITNMIAEYTADKPTYDSMKAYYDGKHEILSKYKKMPFRPNQIVVDNYINKFINEEVQYSLGAPLSYVSKSGKKKIIDAVYNATFHWKENHNQELMRTLQIYGKAYLLHHLDSEGRFCEKILNPSNSIVYCNDEGVPMLFIRFYTPKYETTEYKDIYFPDGRIETYSGNTLIKTNRHFFKGVPVTVCELENIHDTIYFKIKSLQDAYNIILSDQCNTISEFRNAYLVITGAKVGEDEEKSLQEKSVLNLYGDGSVDVKWLVKQVQDGFIQNALDNLKESMYATTNHIDGNEKLQSNTSGTALRNRLVFLEQRCDMMLTIVIDAVYERVKRLFEYLAFTAQGTFDIKDISINAKPNIPQDETTIINALVQLGIGTNISRETALSLLPFIENPLHEMEKITAEQQNADNREINLQKGKQSLTLDLINDRDDDGDL